MRIFNIFRRLQWKLTCSYMLVTISAILIILLIAWFSIWALIIDLGIVPLLTQGIATGVASEASQYFEGEEIDSDGLESWLNNAIQNDNFEITFGDDGFQGEFGPVEWIVIADLDGNVVANQPTNAIQGDNISDFLPDDALTMFQQSQTVQSDLELNHLPFDSDSELFFIPIVETNDQQMTFAPAEEFDISGDTDVVGVALVNLESYVLNLNPSSLSWVGALLLGSAIIVPIMIPVLCAALLIGLVFGLIASRGLVRRLSAISNSADSWSQGNFDVLAVDTSGDEIGQLARRLNRMATQLESLVETRSELSTIEERNRIARDLHDSAKQQIFATTMQLSTAKALFDSHPEAAKQHIAEAEELAKQVQKELSGLIQELRPAALEGKGLIEAVRDSAETWSRQNNIHAVVGVQGARELPLTIEQALFRITQESLNNIAKHSQASEVKITLAITNDAARIAIRDNGLGFDMENPQAGLGLTSMRERIEEVGGTLEIESQPQGGTTVIATCQIA